jgi:hypothetical protein
MKRFALAVVGGFLVPFCYAIIAAPLSAYIANPALDRALMYPVRWPMLLLFRFGYLPFESEIVLLIYLIGCNVFVYSLLCYFLLWRFVRRKRSGQLMPPEPPSLVGGLE